MGWEGEPGAFPGELESVAILLDQVPRVPRILSTVGVASLEIPVLPDPGPFPLVLVFPVGDCEITGCTVGEGVFVIGIEEVMEHVGVPVPVPDCPALLPAESEDIVESPVGPFGDGMGHEGLEKLPGTTDIAGSPGPELGEQGERECGVPIDTEPHAIDERTDGFDIEDHEFPGDQLQEPGLDFFPGGSDQMGEMGRGRREIVHHHADYFRPVTTPSQEVGSFSPEEVCGMKGRDDHAPIDLIDGAPPGGDGRGPFPGHASPTDLAVLEGGMQDRVEGQVPEGDDEACLGKGS